MPEESASPSYSTIKETVAGLMPTLESELVELVRIPSIATEGFPSEPLFEAHDLIVSLLEKSGVTKMEKLEITGKTAPVIIATVPGPAGSPTVLMYSHYDVVPADDVELWDSPPFEPTKRDGAIYGRGTADSKANVIGMIGALRVFDGKPPVTVKLVIEGQEEFGSPFDNYPPEAPELFAADAMVIADVGSVRPGSPTLTVALRGSAQVIVELTTLGADKHNGLYGGAAPDARLALIRALASLHDDNGDVAVDGLLREPWNGSSYTEEEFRTLAEIRDGLPLLGTGGIGERIWSGPAITVTGIDAPPVDGAVNAVASTSRAVINLRVHPRQPAVEAQAALVRHLEALRPFGLQLTVTAGETGDGFAAAESGPAFDAALSALSQSWGEPAGLMAGGGSIPLVMALDTAVPTAEKLLFGATDGYANIHGPNERVLLDELEKAVVAKALFFQEYADTFEGKK
ncbi:M20/M25/M40 family metallo-hydrolase [Rhodococcus sp. GB-02]|uniref:M20/M25/M40 family metallo-hydrolase n=1 Tax=Rhodococcus erythropolis TaxID=1833 RepID=UPI001E524BEB|nr:MULTISPECIES: M20/M25/M40 family metallo-hydrolase [Rhodococcus erythropolis group]MCD2107378.1 M20/M25/M40 family metallo-hydrolase [Rhodococcus qingshengii]MCZ4526927.1 M20/M25/M40 family metallo-hydrolase [Rhodococcus erythropolis]